MREVVFKNFMPIGSRKKDIFLQEVFEKDGMLAKTERRCFYYIKDIKTMASDEELKAWLDTQNTAQGSNINRRQFHIMKEHNDAHSEDKIICKILGTFYAVLNRSVYTIGFLHSFKVRFEKHGLANG